MTDVIRKKDAINTIQNLQLPHHLIGALDNAQEAESIVEALDVLKRFHAAWY